MKKRVKGKDYPIIECLEARIAHEEIIELVLCVFFIVGTDIECYVFKNIL